MFTKSEIVTVTNHRIKNTTYSTEWQLYDNDEHF